MSFRKIDIISASAGSGKTYRLSELLRDEVVEGRVRPDAILATTFTRKAAAELQERVRGRLLKAGRGIDAQRLAASRIGTVNSVCSDLVTSFAFELGLSSNVRVLEQEQADAEFKKVLSLSLPKDLVETLDAVAGRFADVEWREDVAKVCNRARSNGLVETDLQSGMERSLEGLNELHGELSHKSGAQLDEALRLALEQFVSEVARTVKEECDAGRKPKANTALAMQAAEMALSTFARGSRPRWPVWVRLGNLKPQKALKGLADDLAPFAAAHDKHPEFHHDLETLVRGVFTAASQALASYAEFKRERAVIDFIDQEMLALRLLRDPALREGVRAELRDQLDLVLVDEFQDTSPIQLAIFLELAALAKRSVWVGDQKQAIYGFRGADPALMDAAISAIEKDGEVDTLPYSWRSREALVSLTSELFARAFPGQGIPAGRVRLETAPALLPEVQGLGECVERWHLVSKNKSQDAKALASAVRQFLADDGVQVRDPETGALRRVRAGDVAVLCRANDLAADVAQELGALGLQAVLPRAGLLKTPEGSLAMAALRLMVDPRDALAKTVLSRFLEGVDEPDAWLARLLGQPYGKAADELEEVQALRARRGDLPMAGALEVFDAALETLGLDGLSAQWGAAPARRANIERLRTHAVAYVEASESAGAGCTPAGLLAWLEQLATDGDDSQAARASSDAITVSTWHGSKGLEWPVTVLFQLSFCKPGSALGVKLVSDTQTFDLADPLKDRWIRYWPSPFGKSKSAPMLQRLDGHQAQFAAQEVQLQQELRVLYVGWTRARDRLVLAEREGKLLTKGMLKTLSEDGVDLLTELDVPSESAQDPVAGTPADAIWAGVPVDVRVRMDAPSPMVERVLEPGSVLPSAGPREYPPAVVSPSKLGGGAGAGGDKPSGAQRVREPERIGERLVVAGNPDFIALGEAVHGFLAADRQMADGSQPGPREQLAQAQLDRWGVTGAVEASGLVSASDALRSWVNARWPGAAWRREWPVLRQLEGGSLLRGFADLVLETDDGFVVIDHKSFPGSMDQVRERVGNYAGQLTAYRDVVAAATGKTALGCFVHLPVAGVVCEVGE